MANPRIDELRKRLDKDPASRLFAQLAEELRKEGELEDAIRVCREGLAKHPSYPAARMTLGRALLDSGDYAGARAEFEAVVKAVPDNALAHRFLGECQQAQGDSAAATASYRAALMFAPGDAESAARLAALTGEAPPARPAPQRPPAPPTPGRPMAVPAAARAGTAPPPSPPRPPAAERPAPPPPPPAQATARALPPPSAPPKPEPEPAAAPAPVEPVPLAPASEEFELEPAHEAAPVALTGERVEADGAAPAEVAPEPAPIKLVEVAEDETFELERPVEAPAAQPPAPAPPPPPSRAMAPPAVAAGAGREEAEFDLDVEQPAAPAAAAAPPLATATLAELYLQQGAREQAQAVLKQVLAREPENERARELSMSSAAPLDPKAQRRVALERTIERLERMLDAVQRARA